MADDKKDVLKDRTMMVKTVTKGFYLKRRNPGDMFSFTGKQCPPWCIEVNAKGPAKTSKDITPVTTAATFIKTLKTIEDVQDFCAGDERVGVLSAMVERIEELEKETA